MNAHAANDAELPLPHDLAVDAASSRNWHLEGNLTLLVLTQLAAIKHSGLPSPSLSALYAQIT